MASITLNPKSEFEAQLARMVEMYREKTAAYGTDEDPLANFYGIADITHVTPLQAVEVLAAKHGVVVKKFLGSDGTVTHYTDDAYLDRAVYAVLALVLYDRFKDA